MLCVCLRQVFSMSSLERCLVALGSFHYAGHIIFLVMYIVLELMPAPKTKASKKKA
jgi:hypothetical protein